MIAGSARHQWLLALGLALGPATSNGFGRFAYGLILPAMREDLSWTYSEAGWINTANALGYLIGALLALRTISTVGARRLFVWGMIATALALCASATTHDFWMLSFWRIVTGIGGAPVFIAGGAMAATLFKGDVRRNALVIAVYFGGGGAGMLLSGLSIPLIIENLGAASWPSAWLAIGVASALAIVPAAIAAAAVSPPRTTGEPVSRNPLPIASMSAALVSYFLFAVGYIVYVTFLVAWMKTQHASALLVASTWSVLGVAVMLSPFPWRHLLSTSTGGLAIAAACAATGAGTLIPMVVGGPSGLLLSAAVFGLSFFMVPGAVTTFSRKNLPEAQWGPSVALFTTVFAVGQMLGPVAAGLIADIAGNLSLGLIVAGFVLLAAALIAVLQKPLGAATF